MRYSRPAGRPTGIPLEDSLSGSDGTPLKQPCDCIGWSRLVSEEHVRTPRLHFLRYGIMEVHTVLCPKSRPYIGFPFHALVKVHDRVVLGLEASVQLLRVQRRRHPRERTGACTVRGREGLPRQILQMVDIDGGALVEKGSAIVACLGCCFTTIRVSSSQNCHD